MTNSKKIVCVVGTRPEGIKMAPLIQALRKEGFGVTVLSTGQHLHMLNQSLEFFGIRADVNLSIMEERQTLDAITTKVLNGVGLFLDKHPQDLILVHGDTSTTFASALAAFYRGIPIGHVEAGLRSGDIYSPFPEEGNRVLTDRLASLWFAPTKRAAQNLRREGLPVSDETLIVTGNTVIDALRQAMERNYDPCEELLSLKGFEGPLLLMTAHRRESWGAPLESICEAILDILDRNCDVRVLIPLHKNPSVREVIHRLLGDRERVLLTEPLDYPDFVWAMRRSSLILSDSGGVQEESAELKIPLLVMRDSSERPEALEEGTAILVGTDRRTISETAMRTLTEGSFRDELLNRGENPFGSGDASGKIIEAIKRFFSKRTG